MDPAAVWDGECGRSMDGCIRWGGDRRRGRDNFGGESGVSNCNQWGLCDAALPKLRRAGLVYNARVSGAKMLGTNPVANLSVASVPIVEYYRA